MKNFFKTNTKTLEKSFFKIYYPLLMEFEKNEKNYKNDNSYILEFINFSENIINKNYYLVDYHTIQSFKSLKNHASSLKIRKYFYNFVDDIRINYSYYAQKLGYPSSATYHNVKYFIHSFYDLPFIFALIFISIAFCVLLLGVYLGSALGILKISINL